MMLIFSNLLEEKLLISVTHCFFLQSVDIFERVLVLKLQEITYLSAFMIK